MTKDYVLKKLEEHKDETIILGLSDGGALILSGTEGHWLFSDDNQNALVEVKVNTTSGGSQAAVSQQVMPFIVTYINYDVINFVRVYTGDKSGTVWKTLLPLTPIATSKTMDQVRNEIESHSIRKAQSTTGNVNDPHVAPGGTYGTFKGTMVCTEKDGLPQYVKDKLLS